MMLRHYAHCKNPDAPAKLYRGRLGDDMSACTSCGRATRVAEPEPPAPVTPAAPPPPPPSNYRCPQHPDVPVSWRGTGCQVCDNARADYRAARAARRARARAAAER